VYQVVFLRSKGQNVTGLLIEGLRGENRRIDDLKEARSEQYYSIIILVSSTLQKALESF